MNKIFTLLILSFCFLLFSCHDDNNSIYNEKKDTEINAKVILNFNDFNRHLFITNDFDKKESNDFDSILQNYTMDSIIVKTIVSNQVANFAIKLFPRKEDNETNVLYNLVLHKEADLMTKYILKFILSDNKIVKVETLYKDLYHRSGPNCYVLVYAPCDYGHWHSDDDCISDGWKTKVVCNEGGGGSPDGNTDNGPIIPSGEDPSDMGGGGGGSDNNQHHDPCKNLKNKLKNDNMFKQKLTDLKPKVSDTQREHGFINTNPKDNPNLNSAAQNVYLNPKSAESGSINFGINYYIPEIFGFAHTHPTKENSLGIPSITDINTYLNMLKARADRGLSNNDSYGIVVGNYGIYTMMLENNQNFLDVYNNNTSATAKEFWKRFEDNYKYRMSYYFSTLDDISKNNMEKFITEVFKKFYHETGIVMYRMTDDMNSWEKLEFDNNGNIKRTMCK